MEETFDVENHKLTPNFLRNMMPKIQMDQDSTAVNQLIIRCDKALLAEAKKGFFRGFFKIMPIETGIPNFDITKVRDRIIKYYEDSGFQVKLNQEDKYCLEISWKEKKNI